MPRYVAFLRAINVGGHNVKMADLKAVVESAGVSRVETFIASGNVIFDSRASAKGLEAKFESVLKAALGYDVATFVRTAAEVAAIADHVPFNAAQMRGALGLYVGLLKAPLSTEQQVLLRGYHTAVDEFAAHGREVYWVCREKQSDSAFTNARFERAARLTSTWRNVNTMVRLRERLAE